MAKPQPPFVRECCEILGSVGEVRARAMFGGWGLFTEGRMFGLIADEELYLKVDKVNQPEFEAVGSSPFIWTGGEKPMAMGYWSPPSEAFDSREAMAPWARLGLEAALRVRK